MIRCERFSAGEILLYDTVIVDIMHLLKLTEFNSIKLELNTCKLKKSFRRLRDLSAEILNG